MSRFIIEDAPSDVVISDPTRQQLARQSGREMPSPAQGFVTAMQGPLFGFLDEITGGIQGAYTMMDTGDWGKTKQSYLENRDLIRGMEEQYKQDYPTLSRVASAMASAPLLVGGPQYVMGPKAGATAGQQLARDMIGAGVTAAGYGALTAAGESEADDATNLLNEILMRGAKSASTGAAAVPVLRGIGAIAGAGVRMLPERATSGGGKAPLGPLTPAGVGPESFAERKVAEQLIRDLPITNIQKTTAIPTSNIKRPLDRALAYQRWMGKEARMVDIGDENTADLLRLMANMPGQTKTALKAAAEQRIAGRGAQIISEADKALGTGGAMFKQTIDDFERQAISNSTPFYQQVKGVNLPVKDTLREVLQKANKYLGGADEYAASLGISGLGLKDALKGTPIISAGGQQKTVAVVPLSRLDALKQHLYDIEQKFIREGSKNQAAAITSIRRQLIDELDKLSPKDEAGQSIYKLARDAYSGSSQLRDAADIGRKAFDADKDFAIRETIKDMSQSEIAAMRIGLIQAVRENAGTQSGQTWLMNNWKNPNVKEKIQIAFGPDAPRFIAALQKQLKMKGMEGLRGGSQTGKLAFSAEDAGIEPLQNIGAAVATAKAGEPSGLMAAIGSLYRRGQLPEPVRNRIGQILLMKGPQATQELIKIGQLLELIQKQQQAQAGAVGAFAGRNPWLTQEPQQ